MSKLTNKDFFKKLNHSALEFKQKVMLALQHLKEKGQALTPTMKKLATSALAGSLIAAILFLGGCQKEGLTDTTSLINDIKQSEMYQHDLEIRDSTKLQRLTIPKEYAEFFAEKTGYDVDTAYENLSCVNFFGIENSVYLTMACNTSGEPYGLERINALFRFVMDDNLMKAITKYAKESKDNNRVDLGIFKGLIQYMLNNFTPECLGYNYTLTDKIGHRILTKTQSPNQSLNGYKSSDLMIDNVKNFEPICKDGGKDREYYYIGKEVDNSGTGKYYLYLIKDVNHLLDIEEYKEGILNPFKQTPNISLDFTKVEVYNLGELRFDYDFTRTSGANIKTNIQPNILKVD